MVEEEFVVGVVVERRKLVSPWLDHVWMPVAVLPGAPDVAPWTLLDTNAGSPRFYAGSHPVRLYSTDTSQLRDNLTGGDARVWVAARPTGGEAPGEPPLEIVGVTVDPTEGEAYTCVGDDVVEALVMPADVAGRMAAFIDAHHVERPFIKRKRDRADPEALGQRPQGHGRSAGDGGGAGDDD